MCRASALLLLSGCASEVCVEAVALQPGDASPVCGGGWMHVAWAPDQPDGDAPRLDLITTTDLVSTDDLPAGGVWSNTPSLVAWVPGREAALQAEGGAPGVAAVAPAGPIGAEAGLVVVPTRGRTSVVVNRDADLGPIEVWARSEVTVRDPGGRVVGSGREVIWWGPGTGAWEVEVAADWDVVYTRTWGDTFGDAPDEIEPNDGSDAPAVLALVGGAVDWDGFVDGDDDWFSVVGGADQTAELACRDREVGGLVRPTYQVFDPVGRLLRELNPLAYAVGQSQPWNTTRFPLSDGPFLMRITTEPGSAAAYYRCTLAVADDGAPSEE